MGKSQTKKKTQAWRHNPIRVPDAHVGSGKAEGKADPGKEKQMLPILKKLSAPEYADRTWACAAICNLIQNDAATRRLFQSRNVVGELIERLSDSVDEVVVEASGALRNLAIDGGHELCGEMYNKGIMPHLTTLMTKISATIDTILSSDPSVPRDVSDAEDQARKHLLALSENVISLIWCLAEASHKTLNAVNGAGVEGLLIKAVQGRKVVGLGVVLSAVQALYALTQDNYPFTSNLLRHPAAIPVLAELCREDHAAGEDAARKRSAKGKAKSNGLEHEEVGDGRALLARLLACGVLRNIVQPGSRADSEIDIQALTNQIVMPLVNGLLDVDLTGISNRVAELVAEVAQQGSAETQKPSAKAMQTDHRSAAEQTLERIERMLNTVVVALEILTGICAGLEDEELGGEADELAVDEGDAEEMDEDEDMEDGAEMDDEDLINEALDHANMLDEDLGTGGDGLKVKTAVTLQSLISHQLPRRLAHLGQLTPLSFPPAGQQPSSHPPTTSVLSTLHLRSLEALNNLLLTVVAAVSESAEDAARIAQLIPLQDVLNAILATAGVIASEPAVLQEKGQEMRGEVLAMTIGCTWGIVKLGSGGLAISDPQLQLLLSTFPLLRTSLAQARLIETLSLLAARPGVSLSENRQISSTLLSILGATPPPADAETVIALTNALIDIYADETREYDPVFRQDGYLEALTRAVGPVRAAVKKVDKKKASELRIRGEEALENLTAFIKYRRQLV